MLKRILIFFAAIVTLCSCSDSNSKLPSVPAIYYNFNGSCNNTGMSKVNSDNNRERSFSQGALEQCLDLSLNAQYRQPLRINTSDFSDQNDFSVTVWANLGENASEEYTIASSMNMKDSISAGWSIQSTAKGSWKLSLSDGYTKQVYEASASRQRINDDKWHQLAFCIDWKQKIVKYYFDGRNIAIEQLNMVFAIPWTKTITIGCAPDATSSRREAFYGKIDEFGIWNKNLSQKDILSSYNFVTNENLKVEKQPSDDEFSLITWDLKSGSDYYGYEASVNKMTQMLKESEADIICLQNGMESNSYVADALNYYSFKASDQLCVLSKYPIKNTSEVYRSNKACMIEVQVTKNKTVNICPILLNEKPIIRGYLMNKEYSTDSILSIEETARLKDLKLIMSQIRSSANQNTKSTYILAASLNSGSHLDWTEKNKDNKYGKVIPFETTQLIQKEGYTDAYRSIYPSETEYIGNTFSPIFTEGYKDRIDFIFYKSETIEAKNAELITSENSFYPSTHYALKVDFSIKED